MCHLKRYIITSIWTGLRFILKHYLSLHRHRYLIYFICFSLLFWLSPFCLLFYYRIFLLGGVHLEESEGCPICIKCWFKSILLPTFLKVLCISVILKFGLLGGFTQEDISSMYHCCAPNIVICINWPGHICAYSEDSDDTLYPQRSWKPSLFASIIKKPKQSFRQNIKIFAKQHSRMLLKSPTERSYINFYLFIYSFIE